MTNEERRQVASRLRRLSGLDYCKDPRYAVEIVSDAVGADHFNGGYGWDKLIDKIANLIDAEPERTCHVDSWRYETVGGVTFINYDLSCGHESDGFTIPDYCPRCGAMVMHE